jgi:hypothetical protein
VDEQDDAQAEAQADADQARWQALRNEVAEASTWFNEAFESEGWHAELVTAVPPTSVCLGIRGEDTPLYLIEYRVDEVPADNPRWAICARIMETLRYRT